MYERNAPLYMILTVKAAAFSAAAKQGYTQGCCFSKGADRRRQVWAMGLVTGRIMEGRGGRR